MTPTTPTCLLPMTETELVLMEDLLNYAVHTFEAETPADAERFVACCTALLTKVQMAQRVSQSSRDSLTSDASLMLAAAHTLPDIIH